MLPLIGSPAFLAKKLLEHCPATKVKLSIKNPPPVDLLLKTAGEDKRSQLETLLAYVQVAEDVDVVSVPTNPVISFKS